MKSFAQNGEDKLIIDLFLKKNIKSGLFVEFGAWDGVHLSNCKLLADHNWSGFFIEENSLRFEECKKNYKSNNKIKVLNKFIDERYTLNDLIKDNNINEIDVLSIDIDGKDLAELKRLNLVKPKVIIIEFNSTISFDVECEDDIGGNGSSYLSINNYLSKNNYELINFTQCNLIFIEKDFNQNENKKVEIFQMIEKLRPVRIGFNNFGEMFFIENKKIVKKEFYKFPLMKNFIVFQPVPKFIRNITDEDGKGFKILKIIYSNLILLILRPNLFLEKIFYKIK
ncbi:Methyltransferase FkbM [Candidatus Pelagibacterales bacterium]